jgi:hypothetical protein
MRSLGLVTLVVLLTLRPTAGTAQDVSTTSTSSTTIQVLVHHPPPTPTVDVNDRIRRLMEKVRPLQDRVVQDDRLRTASGIVGLGIAAYEASRNGGQLPLGAVGTEALRLGLHHQLASIQHQSGYSVEPSIGRRSFALTLRKTLD